jgi:hypothetical protein
VTQNRVVRIGASIGGFWGGFWGGFCGGKGGGGTLVEAAGAFDSDIS